MWFVRMAPADVQSAFAESVQKSAVPAQALGENVDVKKLPGVEALCSDGVFAWLEGSKALVAGRLRCYG